MDWIWIIVGLAVVAVFAAIAATVTAVRNSRASGRRKEVRPGYQDIIVRNAVDIKNQKYIPSGVYFPNPVGIEAGPTVLTEDNLRRWDITLSDMDSSNCYKCCFNGGMTIGRDPVVRSDEFKMVITDAVVSKTHCRIQSKGNSLELIDLRSKNGTYLNGKLLSGPELLRSGDIISLGSKSFSLHIN